MKHAPTLAPLALAAMLSQAMMLSAASLRLDEMELSLMTTGWGKPRANASVTGNPLRLAGATSAHGVGTHAESECPVVLDGRTCTFTARVGVDDAANGPGSVEFIVLANDLEVWRSGVCRKGEAARECRVDLTGVTNLLLLVTDAGDGIHFDHANWADASFEFEGEPPRVALPPVPHEDPVLLTPPAPAHPRLNGSSVVGVRPDSPLLHRIPCTGERPMTFRAEHLPEGLTLDAKRGIITGRLGRPGTHHVVLTATNTHGQASRDFRIVVGDTLALTPPMGWNSWYIHYHRVSDRIMREAADQMIATGMADYGYEYVNVDDCWMVKANSADPEIGGPMRDASGRLLPNKRFPDMKAMTDYIHALGLKAGTYISPGPTTCAGYAGSYGHEPQDARTFAEWGFDFLKYDWCSYGSKAGGTTLEHLRRPYQQMWDLLRALDRDIVLNLCQYGMGEVWAWGGEVGHCWRTTGDLGLQRGARLPGFYPIGLSNARHCKHARPGAWNDPDYLLLGWVGSAHEMGVGVQTALTPSEQYSYMSMWCLMAAPLIFSGDMAKLDAFTLNVLCNHEVIELDQDPLGRQARILRQSWNELVMVKDLEDGSQAVGLFNLGHAPARIALSWSEAGLTRPKRLRDVWRQKDLNRSTQGLAVDVPRHGVALVRVWPSD